MAGKAGSDDTIKIFDMSGEKRAFLFSWSAPGSDSIHPNKNDVDQMAAVVTELGFRICTGAGPDDELIPSHHSHSDGSSQPDGGTSDAEYIDPAISNLTSLFLKLLLNRIADNNMSASCLLLYFVATQSGSEYVDRDNQPLNLIDRWRALAALPCPKIIIIQGNVSAEPCAFSALLNADSFSKGDNLPASANTLLAYFPNFCDSNMSIAGILREKLKNAYDINTILTSVIKETTISRFTPRFSSTLLKQLYLRNGSISDQRQLPHYEISENKKCLVYTFLFGQYRDYPKCSLMSLVKIDKPNLKEAFDFMGFDYEFCVPDDGIMTVEVFKSTLEKIVNDKGKMNSCECIIILISSHGDENGAIFAYDGFFSRDYVLDVLTNCKGLENKPKALFIDACRGLNDEKSKKDFKFTTTDLRNGEQPPQFPVNRAVMPDIIQVLSTTEGNKSYAGSSGGSLCITTLCEKLKAHGRKHYLMTLLNTAMHDVAQWKSSLKQQITFTSTLRKLLRFR